MTKKTSAKAPAKKAKVASKKAPNQQASAGEVEVAEAMPEPTPPPPPVVQNIFNLKISDSLAKKIKDQAEEEGLSPEELAAELLTEGVVVRAWEIVERRITMRQGVGNKPQHASGNGNGNNAGNGNGGGQRNGGGRRNNNRRGGMSNNRYQNIMEDRASFLEYVRNQERQGR